MRKKIGRPPTVTGGQRCTVLLGAAELRILANAERMRASHRDANSRSCIVRQMVRASWATSKAELKDIWQKEMIIADLQRQLEESQRALARAEAEINALRAKRQGRESVAQRLAQLAPLVRERARLNLPTPSGNQFLDQVWYNMGRSWHKVLERIENTPEPPT